MARGLFVLNADLSGINSYMFQSLRERGWDVRVADIGVPSIWRGLVAARSFNWKSGRWKESFSRRLESFTKSPRGLAARSAICSRAVRSQARPDDIVLSFGLLFSPRLVEWRQPLVTFKDYTVELLRRSRWRPPIGASELSLRAELEADLCRYAAVVFTASENTRRAIIQDYGVFAERVESVGEGLCFDALPQPRRAEPNGSNILFIGKDFERKGGDVLLAAFARLRQRTPAACLTIVGPAPQGPDAGGVRWAGLIRDRATIRKVYEKATMFVLPSRCEPFGLVLLEAMSHGLPCIGTRVDAMSEIIVQGRTGYLVEAGDANALCEAMLALIENPKQAAEMGRRGHERVTNRFQWAHVAARMDMRLQRLLDSRPSARGG